MVQHAELTRDSAAQAVCPSTIPSDLLGALNTANLAVSAGAQSAQSLEAPRSGVMIVGFPNGFDARIDIGANPVAANIHPLYMGPNVWHFPVNKGDRIQFFGGAVTGTVTICMAKG